MLEQFEDQQVEVPADVPLPTDAEIESKIDGEIATLWTAHQTGKATSKRTKLELEAIRRDLGERLWSMKSLLACTGRLGGWSAYLRTHSLPRATADRYVNQHQESMMPAANRLSEAIPEPAMEDVKKLVQRILPRLRPILTTEELISEFLYEVVQQLAASNRQPSDKLAA
jgi:hypothetical protein